MKKCDGVIIEAIDLFKSYPFDWKTPLGYAGYIFIQLPSTILLEEAYTSAISFTIGFCMFIADFANDIKEKLSQFNRILISSEESDFTAKERNFFKKRLKEIIAFDSKARELSITFFFSRKKLVCLLESLSNQSQIRKSLLGCKQRHCLCMSNIHRSCVWQSNFASKRCKWCTGDAIYLYLNWTNFLSLNFL